MKKSLNDIYNDKDAQGADEEIIVNASTEAYDDALKSLEEAREIRRRHKKELDERMGILKSRKEAK